MGRSVQRPRQLHVLVSFLVGFGLLAAMGCASWRGARLYQRGTETLEQGNSDHALVLLEEAARLAPEASEVRNHLGLAQLAVGRDELALESFELATQLDCDNLAARDNLVRLKSRMLREAAIASVSTPRRVAPGDAGAESNGEAP